MNSEQLLQLAVEAADEKKAMNVVALDLQGVSLIADYFVICHGNSETQVQAIAEAVKERISKQGGYVRGIEGLNTARWVLIDLGDVVVHIFHREEREYYNIERIWSDAKVVNHP